MSSDVEFEMDVLASCMTDPAYTRAAAPVLRTYSFSTPQNSWVWRVLSDNFEKTRELPTPRLYATYILRDFAKEDERTYLLKTVKLLLTRHVAAPKSALEEIRKFARLSALRRALAGGIDGLDGDDVESAEAALSAGLMDARSALVLADPSSGDAWAERLDLYTGKAGTIYRYETPLPTINRITGGGLTVGAVALVVAQTNVGKSTWVVDVGFTAALRDTRVHIAHVTTEETEREAFGRYDARITGIERGRLLGGHIDEHDAELFRIRMTRASSITSRLHVMEMAPGTSSAALWAFVERVREKAGPGAPILLCVDSPDHLGPPQSAAKKDHRLQVAAVYWQLKAMTKDKDIGPLGAWAVTWAPAEFDKKRMNANATSESKEKGRIADFMLGMSDGEGASSEDDDQEVVFDVLKNRIGKVKSLRIVSSANLGTCEFKEMDSKTIES